MTPSYLPYLVALSGAILVPTAFASTGAAFQQVEPDQTLPEAQRPVEPDQTLPEVQRPVKPDQTLPEAQRPMKPDQTLPEVSRPDFSDERIRRCPMTARRTEGLWGSETCRCSGLSEGPVYGTDVYMEGSRICSAAVHAGVIGQRGGVVTYAMRFGRDKYEGSTRNGVTSKNYDRWTKSFTFPLWANRPDRDVQRCPTDADAMTDRRESLTCRCSANATQSGEVWGTGAYTTDSEICRAALHAGLIGPRGGVVKLSIRGGRDKYEGSYRNGVFSEDHDAWPRSYVFPLWQ